MLFHLNEQYLIPIYSLKGHNVYTIFWNKQQLTTHTNYCPFGYIYLSASNAFYSKWQLDNPSFKYWVNYKSYYNYCTYYIIEWSVMILYLMACIILYLQAGHDEWDRRGCHHSVSMPDSNCKHAGASALGVCSHRGRTGRTSDGILLTTGT